MNVELYQPFSATEQLIHSIRDMFAALGILALVFVLILGLIYFAPTIIASMRNIRLKALVCIVNVGTIPLFFVRMWLPAILWLVLMILSIVGKRKRPDSDLPNITIQTGTWTTNDRRK